GEMRDNDEFTLSLLTNEEVLKMHQEGSGARQVYRYQDRVVWQSSGPNQEIYLALFNIADVAQTVSVALEDIGIKSDQIKSLTDLWQKQVMPMVNQSIKSHLRPHACQLLKIELK